MAKNKKYHGWYYPHTFKYEEEDKPEEGEVDYCLDAPPLSFTRPKGIDYPFVRRFNVKYQNTTERPKPLNIK